MLNPIPLRPRKFLNPLYTKKSISAEHYDRFKQALKTLTDSLNPVFDEEHNKKYIQTFLEDAYYRDTNHINTKGRTDLAIYDGKHANTDIRVLVETKRPGNKSEMVTKGDLNAKALHELVLYYFRERFENRNLNIQHLVITDGWEWFVIDATEFERVFGRSKELKKMFDKWNQKGQLVASDTATFYNFVKNYISGLKRPKADLFDDDNESLKFAYFNLKEAAYKTEATYRAIYKLLHPDGLLKKFNPNDANSLNREFYAELLHIIGLEEKKVDGKKQIVRKSEKDRQAGSLFENVLHILERHEKLTRISEEERFAKVVELCMVWINRILFLKLLESQLISYHKGDQSYRFLSAQKVGGYDELERLFFDVLAKRPAVRSDVVKNDYGFVPYLNSSLFEHSEIEKELFFISSIPDSPKLDYYSKTILHHSDKKRRTGSVEALPYLLDFLDAYNFTDDGSDELVKDSKALINASVLGLVFEKINGFKEGSFYTPSFVTMYMARQTILQAVLKKFNDHYGWSCSTLQVLQNKIDSVEEANELIDSLTVCDPAVGSGHFLVSCLNEVIRIKSELRILVDESGARHRDWQVEIVNDELVVRNDDGDIFEYHRPQRNGENQKIQKMLFNQKRRIIENSLFGVDINPNSVNICRLRLWIELLKNAYYTEESNFTELETLPNIDINIKCGNSLISRFPLDDTQLDKKNRKLIEEYKESVWMYKEADDKATKERMEMKIKEITSRFSADLKDKDKKEQKLRKTLNDYIHDYEFRGLEEKLIIEFASNVYLGLYAKGLSGKLFDIELNAKETKSFETKRKAALKPIKKMYEQIKEIERARIFDHAFEWRFEFPEVLDNEGNFVGFDVVIGNPPYIRQEEFLAIKPYLREQYQTFSSMADLSSYFIERGMQIAKPNGQFSYIVTNKWMRTGYGAPLRNFLKISGMRELIDFGDLPVFEEATAYPCILSLCKGSGTEKFSAVKAGTLEFVDLQSYLDALRYEVEVESLQESGWSLSDVKTTGLIDKLHLAGVPLGKYVEGNIYYGIKTGLNEAFVISEEKRNELIMWDPTSVEIIKPFLAGKDIKRYVQPTAKNYLIFTRRGIDIDKYPAIKAHLEKYKEQLMLKPKEWDNKKDGNWKGRKAGSYQWYEIQDNIAYYQEFEKPKIVYQEISSQGNFTYDPSGSYGTNTMYLLCSTEIFLIALLNSKLMTFVLAKLSSEIRGGFLRWTRQYVELLPIPLIDEEQKKPFVTLVEAIMQAKKEGHDTVDFEAKIDTMVYNLFDLTPEEIALIEKE